MLDREGIQLRDILLRAVGPERADTAYDAILSKPSVSVRVNPSKVSSPEEFAKSHFPEYSRRVEWCPSGFMLSERPSFTLDPLFHCGCYYVQDSSAMAVGHVFRNMLKRFGDVGRPVRVLDLCAAPGGKSTDAASSLRAAFGDMFVLVSNEVMGGRAGILADNMAVWGDPNVVVTCSDPKAFAKLSGFFDIIIADVPCSGEGMFRKDDEAVEDWSPDAVDFCAQRQRRILADVWPALREGGVLVYSTCTFEEAENDANVRWVAEELGGTVVEGGLSGMDGVISTATGALLVPGFVKGEGQFAAALVKTSRQGEFRQVKNFGRVSAGADGMVEKVRGGGLVVGIPEAIAGEVEALEVLRPIQTCVALGTRKGKDFIPSADRALSLALREGTYPSLDVDLATALKYLHRDAVAPGDAPKGFLTVRYEGHILGFVKNLGNRCNNLHPQGRRIRMDV